MEFFQINIFFTANAFEQYIVTKDYCFANQDDKMCFLSNCRYQKNQIVDNVELLQKLDALCLNYQPVDCLDTILKYRYNDQIVVKSGKRFEIVQRTNYFNQPNIELDRMLSFVNRAILNKRYKNHLLGLSRRLNRRKPVGQFLQTELNKLKRPNSNQIQQKL